MGPRVLFIFAVLLLALNPAPAQTNPDLQHLAHRVDTRYNHLSTLQANFVETYTGNGLTKRESGTLWLKRPGKMLWHYELPQPKIFLSDGKTAYFYVPGEAQGRKAPLKQLDDLRSPLRYLLGKTKLLKEFDGLKVVPSSTGNTIFEGVPKGMHDQISNVRLTTQNGLITGIRIAQLDGSVTEFAFSNIEENVPVADAEFRPTAAPGTHWIESSDLGPE